MGLGPSVSLEAEALSCECLADTAYIGMSSLLSPRYYSAGVAVLMFTPDAIACKTCGWTCIMRDEFLSRR